MLPDLPLFALNELSLMIIYGEIHLTSQNVTPTKIECYNGLTQFVVYRKSSKNILYSP